MVVVASEMALGVKVRMGEGKGFDVREMEIFLTTPLVVGLFDATTAFSTAGVWGIQVA